MPTVMDYVPGSGVEGLYFRDEQRDHLLCGLHTNEVLAGVCSDPNDYRRGVDDDFAEEIAHRLLTRLPKLRDMQLVTGWAGLYPNSPDGEFVIGPSNERPEVVLACGVGGVGLYTSPLVGRLAAEWVVYAEPRALDWATAFSPTRFDLSRSASG
jgi:sarcosine oxidase subunit beta